MKYFDKVSGVKREISWEKSSSTMVLQPILHMWREIIWKQHFVTAKFVGLEEVRHLANAIP
jgi:hypothetical protein